jgi:hypothetical protein
MQLSALPLQEPGATQLPVPAPKPGIMEKQHDCPDAHVPALPQPGPASPVTPPLLLLAPPAPLLEPPLLAAPLLLPTK